MNHSTVAPVAITEPLLAWGLPRLRNFPWRDTRDRWSVLVSEVMLQQTQVSRVVPKYEAFIAAYPTAANCAAAPLADLLRLWSGLGYPRRCKNLHEAAKQIVAQLGGQVPGELAALCALPGVGPYTARAVMAFADGADVAVVDTNVARVLARVTNMSLSARQSQDIADQVQPRGLAWEWNQVMMDFGAQVCTSRVPKCDACPIVGDCAWDDGDDPARTSALTSKPQPRFDGSDRQARGRLMKVLAERSARRSELASVMGFPSDDIRATRLLDSLVRDGLVVVDGEWCRLP